MEQLGYQKTILVCITHPGSLGEGAGKRHEYPRLINHRKFLMLLIRICAAKILCLRAVAFKWILAPLIAPRQSREK